MTSGTKRPGSPLEGGTTKSFIVGLANHGVPSPRVAHPQKLGGVTGTPDFPRGVDFPAEGTLFNYFVLFSAT